jgi:hypothetical protein
MFMTYSETELNEQVIECKKCKNKTWKHLKGDDKFDQSVYCMKCGSERNLTNDEFYHGGITVE